MKLYTKREPATTCIVPICLKNTAAAPRKTDA